MPIDRQHLRDFALRPWAEIERRKREHLAERARRDPEAHVTSIHALYEHVRAVRPEWPTRADLDRDLEGHVALKRKLDRAARAAVTLRDPVR